MHIHTYVYIHIYGHISCTCEQDRRIGHKYTFYLVVLNKYTLKVSVFRKPKE